MKAIFYIISLLFCGDFLQAQPRKVLPSKVLVLYEDGGHHLAYSLAAKKWLNQLASDRSFTINYITSAQNITETTLGNYQLVIQLDYPPYSWPTQAVKAFEQYIEKGNGGWIGFHHATLLGEFDGFPMWSWFSRFMGNITFKNYISTFADGMVKVENQRHPVMQGIPPSFMIQNEEWYTYDRSPRSKVNVLASVDESSYHPSSNVKMVDHPVVWINEHVKARNVYIFMGHSPDLFRNEAYKKLFSNAIFWTLKRNSAIKIH